MTVKGIKGGSRLRHVQGNSLKDLEDMLESLTYRVEIINVNKVGANWYVHFYIPQTEFDSPDIVKEEAKPTITKRSRRRK
jgi:hypothetical protein